MAKKILVADDDPAILDSIKIILELENYEVEIIADGGALYKMERDYPDLLLLDIWMSGQDGCEICKYLKNNPRTKNIPVIMISASKDIAKSAMDSGADDFIAKPFEIDDLLDIVEKYINPKE